MFKKIFSLFFIITLINLFGKGLGFIREMFIAKHYGASSETDVFNIAVSIPESIYVAFGLAISSGFIPIFLKWKAEKSEDEARELYQSVSTYLFLISSLIVAVLYLTAPYIVQLYAPGFNDEQHQKMTWMLYMLIPSLYFYIFSGLSVGILNAEKRFILPSLTSVVHNVSMIFAIVFLTKEFGLYGLAFGFSFGVFLQFLLQVPPVFKKVVHLTENFRKHSKEVKEIFIQLLPIIITSLIVQLNLFIDRFVASFLDAGSVSAMNYANKIIYLPISIFVFTLATIFYTNLVETAQNSTTDFKKQMSKYFLILIGLTIPIALFMMIFPEWIVTILYGRGEFGEDDIALTASVLFWYAVAFFFINLKDFAMKATMAAQKNKMIVWFTLLGVSINISLSFLLGFKMGPQGIALATAIAMGIQFTVNYLYLKFYLK